MLTFDVITNLRDRGYPIDDYITATTKALDWHTTQQEYEQMLFEVLGSGVRSEFETQAKLLLAYVIREAIRIHVQCDSDIVDSIEVLENAKKLVQGYFEVFSSKVPVGKCVRWSCIVVDELEQMKQLMQDRYVRPTSKQDQAIAIVLANPMATSKQLQELFRNTLSMTINGAATYVYNVRKILKQRVVVSE